MDPAFWSPVWRTASSSSGCIRSRSVATTCSIPRTQDLDRHLATVVQRGPVDDGDRGPTDRFGIEVDEGVAQRHPEVVLDALAHQGEGLRRTGVQARPELLGHLVAEHARGRGHDLAEFDERAPEVLEGQPERMGDGGSRQGPPAGLAQLSEGQRGEVPSDREGDLGAPAGQFQA